MTLLQELIETWPPTEEARGGGYVRAPLAAMTPVAATALGAGDRVGLAVVVTRDAAGGLSLAPLARDAGTWRRARPRDGASAAVVAGVASQAPLTDGFRLERLLDPGQPQGERAIGVDQTNESVVVGDRAVVKWLAEPVLRDPAIVELPEHLAAAGFQDMPRPLGRLSWAADGRVATLAQVTAWLPDAADGWDWCVADVLAHVLHGATCPGDCPGLRLGARLGRLAGALHAALATPTSRIPAPVSIANAALIADWHRTAIGALDRALAAVDGVARTELAARADALRARIDTLAQATTTPMLRIHGDLHVGQVLRSGDRLVVIDLEDDVSLPVSERGRPLPAARDVAQLCSSLDHVGRIVDRRTDGAHGRAVDAWVDQARQMFLAAYVETLTTAGRAELFDARLLVAFEAERVCREILYAAGTLPRWMYAPLGTLRRMIPR